MLAVFVDISKNPGNVGVVVRRDWSDLCNMVFTCHRFCHSVKLNQDSIHSVAHALAEVNNVAVRLWEQVLLATLQKAISDDCASCRSVSAFFVSTVSCIDKQLAANVLNSSTREHIDTPCDRHSILCNLRLWINRKAINVAWIKRINHHVSSSGP